VQKKIKDKRKGTKYNSGNIIKKSTETLMEGRGGGGRKRGDYRLSCRCKNCLEKGGH